MVFGMSSTNMSKATPALAWNTTAVHRMEEQTRRHVEILEAIPGKHRTKLFHDPLTRVGGSTAPWLMLWWFIECLPMKYFNLEKNGQWVAKHGWNLGCGRDIPDSAKYHPSLRMLFRAGVILGVPQRGDKDPFSIKNLWGIFTKKKPVYYDGENYVDVPPQVTTGTLTNGTSETAT
jgi:hypothetical protein